MTKLILASWACGALAWGADFPGAQWEKAQPGGMVRASPASRQELHRDQENRRDDNRTGRPRSIRKAS